jgi:hypothetical protein
VLVSVIFGPTLLRLTLSFRPKEEDIASVAQGSEAGGEGAGRARFLSEHVAGQARLRGREEHGRGLDLAFETFKVGMKMSHPGHGSQVAPPPRPLLCPLSKNIDTP